MSHRYLDETMFPLSSERVQEAIDKFIEKSESKPVKYDTHMSILKAKETVYIAFDEGRITQKDLTRSLCKLAAYFSRFTKAHPDMVIYEEEPK